MSREGIFEEDSPYYGMDLKDMDPALVAELWATGGIKPTGKTSPGPTKAEANEAAIRAEIEANGGSGSRGSYYEQLVFEKILEEQQAPKDDVTPSDARKVSDLERALTERAVGNYNRLSSLYYPVQEQMARSANDDLTGHLAGRANADINAGASGSANLARRTAAEGGFALDSTGNRTLMSGIGDVTADGRANMFTTARGAAQNTQDARRQGVVGLSYGLESATGAGSYNLAKDEVSSSLSNISNRLGVIDAKNAAKLAKKQARKGVIGSILGSAVSLGGAAMIGGLI